MKSDARLLLNKKKWGKSSGSHKTENWKSRGTVDARKILNLKRSQKSKTPFIGNYMRTKTATALITSHIRKGISPAPRVPDKHVKLSKDGNIIITAKPKNVSQMTGRNEMAQKMNFGLSSKSKYLGNSMQYEPSTSEMDDLEHTAIEDMLDVESLPPAYVSSNYLQNANLSRKPVVNQVLDKRHTMVADQFSQPSSTLSAKVFVSNLHPTVSRQDVMELFGDVGVIRNTEMIMPGTAVIDFFSSEDAEKACEIYHNRLLDGVPMKCRMQRDAEVKRTAISHRLGDRVVPHFNPIQKPVIPVVSTNPRSRYNPRNVQFTVKLT